MSMSDEIFFANLSAMNERFWSGSLGPDGLNQALESFGLVVERSVLVQYVPDSGTTWLVRVIDQDGKYVEFDVDLDPVTLLEKRELNVPVKARDLREYVSANKLSQLVRNSC